MTKRKGPWLDLDEQRAWRAYLLATQLLFSRLTAELERDSSLSHPDYEILVRLSEAPDRRLRMSELADNALFSRSRISHAVSRLEQDGLVRRTECKSDARGRHAELTDPGFAVLAAAAPGHARSVRRYVFDPLSPAEVAQLEHISKTVLEQLDAPPRQVGAAAATK